MNNPFKYILTSESEIREILGFPGDLVKKKVINKIDKHCSNFIALSPLLFLSTADNQGNCDVSPRGDAPGSVLVLNENYLVIPERPGNRRVDTLKNIIQNPKIGILFIIPGLGETLRINGHAYVIKDEEILKKMQAHEKQPVLGIGVRVEECFIHCAKAFIRSKAWESGSWHKKENLPSIATILSTHLNSSEFTEDSIREGFRESYEKRLY